MAKALKEESRPVFSASARNEVALGSGIGFIVRALQQEISELAKTPSFGPYVPGEKGGSLDNIDQFFATAKLHAPRWCQLLEATTRHVKNSTAPPMGKQVVVILAQLCFTMHRNSSDNLPTLLGLYLYQGGCRRRVLVTLNNLGLVKSYKPLQQIMTAASEGAKSQVRALGKSFSSVTTYDNLEFTDNKRGERLSDKKSFISITTALAFPGQEIPENGLLQSWWKPSIALKATDFIRKLSTVDGMDKKVTEATLPRDITP